MTSRHTISIGLPFRRTFVLNYGGDEGRWQRFLRQNAWLPPTQTLNRALTIDPRRVRPPRQWQGSMQNWARVRGLLAVFEHCLNHRIPTAMVLEDDAVLEADGREHFDRFVSELPVDWQLLVLGGRHQYLRRGVPTRVSEAVYRPYSVARSPAFIWRGYPMLRRLYDFYLKCSVDPIMQRDYFAVRRPRSRYTYAPGEWIFYSDGTSHERESAWQAAAFYKRTIPQTVVAVLAGYRGGSSCIAGVLHRLGISMGEILATPDAMNPSGYFECMDLVKLCWRAFHHPSMARRLPRKQIAGLLRQWSYVRSDALPQATHIGAKFPSLCCMGEEMLEAWDKSKFVVVDRPAEEIVASILRTDWGWSRAEAAINVAMLNDQRERFLASCDEDIFIRIDFRELCNSPQREVRRLVDWLAIPVSQEQLDAAVEHIRPSR